MNLVLANLLTIGRLLLGLAFPWIPIEARLVVVVTGGLSDFVDGVWSRMWNATSTFGRVLDPIADKVFVLSVIGTLCWEGTIALWQVLLLALRDVAVLGGGLWFALRRRPGLDAVRPRWSGKLATAAQLAFLVSIFAAEPVQPTLFWLAAALTGWAAVDYAVQLIRDSASRCSDNPQLNTESSSTL